MTRVTRIDVGSLDKFERTPSGGLRIPAVLTRVGVLTYRTPDGDTVRELRPPEEVLDAASVASLEDAPVTDLHPPDLVKPETWKAYALGSVRAARVDGDQIAGDCWSSMPMRSAASRRASASRSLADTPASSTRLRVSPRAKRTTPFSGAFDTTTPAWGRVGGGVLAPRSLCGWTPRTR